MTRELAVRVDRGNDGANATVLDSRLRGEGREEGGGRREAVWWARAEAVLLWPYFEDQANGSARSNNHHWVLAAVGFTARGNDGGVLPEV